MEVIPVEFECQLPISEPIFLELVGVRQYLPLTRRGDSWGVTVEMTQGVYTYRYRVGDSVAVGDPRRTTHRVVDDQLWSVVHVTPEGPVWIERPFPRLEAVEICQGVSEAAVPVVALKRLTPATIPFWLWLQVTNLYQSAAVQLFLLRPDGALAFGGEFWLDSTKTAPDCSARFWLSIDFESENLIAGYWTFLIKVEGVPVWCREIQLELVEQLK